MSPPVKHSCLCHRQHNNIDDHSRENVEAVETCDTKEISAKSNRARSENMRICRNRCAIIGESQPLQFLMRHQRSPGIMRHRLTPMLDVIIHQNQMITSNEVMPFPCLTTQKCKSAKNRPAQPFHNSFPVSMMSLMHSQHHRYGAHDQNKCHHTYKSKRQIGFTRPRKRIKHHAGCRPIILTETNSSV